VSRQWDTKREFKPDYRKVAGGVFLGWWRVLTVKDWAYTFRSMGEDIVTLARLICLLIAALLMLVLSPVVFPLWCFLERRLQRRNRLYWIKRNRAADEDI